MMSDTGDTLRPPALDPGKVPALVGSRSYPELFRAAIAGRERGALSDPLGLTKLGVGLTRLAPGSASAQRHWHSKQDEFVFVVEGELTLVTDGGEQVLGTGMAAGFPAGEADGHMLVNKSDRDAVYLEVGDRTPGDEVDYPDIDMLVRRIDGEPRFVHNDGTPY